jgi:hypothetical protein
VKLLLVDNYSLAVESMKKISEIQDYAEKYNEICKFCTNLEDIGPFLFKCVEGLNSDDCDTLVHGMGSVSKIIEASMDSICDNTPLEKKKAEKVSNFFKK